jgi:16S rRNA (adenine1518-N6/adenine1519-N6)-dimethyltransferase
MGCARNPWHPRRTADEGVLIKAKLGQNFLVSPTAPRTIVAAAGDLHEQVVLEIGPGRGAITGLLEKAARRLVAVEYDHELAQTLIDRYRGVPNVDIITNDILRVNLTLLAERESGLAGGESVKLVVVGNLPYYITSEILLHLYQHADALDRAVVMTQREVADRLCAQPGTREYGLLTVTSQLYADVERLFQLAPEDFSPSPDVYSTVVRLHFAPRFEELDVEPDAFIAFLRKCFAQKRKTLGNNLRAAGYPPERLDAAWTAAEVSRESRAEALPLERLAALFRALRSPRSMPAV